MKMRRAAGITVKAILIVLVLGIVGIISLLALASLLKADSVTLPKPIGPYVVGRTFFDWVDRTRVDPFAPTPGTPRELPVWIWYPAKPGPKPLAEYLPTAVREALLERANPVIGFFGRLLTVDQADVRAQALERPALLDHPSKFPVVLMKPGYGGLVPQYSTLAEDLASHGYLVVGSDSPYTSPVAVYEDGRVAMRTTAGHPSESAPGRKNELAPGQPNDLAVAVAKVWAEDLQFMLDRLHDINASGSSEMFAGRLDLEAVGAFGHSFGGAVSLQFCKDDTQCKGAIDIDGAIWGDVALGGLTKPALFIFSDRPILRLPVSELSPDQKALMDALGRIRAGLPNRPNQLVLSGSSHYNFADSALLVEPHAGRFLGMIGPIDPHRALDVTRRYIRAFFDTFLKGKPDKLLEGTSPEYPEAFLE
jgi:predicted dienelactone hydrolase